MTTTTIPRAAIGGIVAALIGIGVWLAYPPQASEADRAMTAPAPIAPAPIAPAPIAPAPVADVSPPVVRTLETPTGRQTFEERVYAPEYALVPLTERPPEAWLTTPEATLASLFSAMQAGDWSWAMSLFDDSSPEWRAQAELDHDKYLAAWTTGYAPHHFSLTKKHVLGAYAVIYTHRDDRPPGHVADAYPYALRQDASGRWWLTHELDLHPVKNLAMIEALPRRTDDATR